MGVLNSLLHVACHLPSQNMAHISHPWPDSDRGFQATVLNTVHVVPSSLESGIEMQHSSEISTDEGFVKRLGLGVSKVDWTTPFDFGESSVDGGFDRPSRSRSGEEGSMQHSGESSS